MYYFLTDICEAWTDEVKGALGEMVPMGRAGQPEEIVVPRHIWYRMPLLHQRRHHQSRQRGYIRQPTGKNSDSPQFQERVHPAEFPVCELERCIQYREADTVF